MIGLLAAVLAAAPVVPPPPADTIVVTGTRRTPAAIREQATAFVRATGVAMGEVPAARWADPVCPRVVGLNDEPAVIVEAKLRAVAAAGGVPVAAAGCTPNIAVVFTVDAAATVARLAARHPRVFARMPAARVAALRTGDAPIRWWYQSEARDRDGMPATTTSPPPAIFGPAEGGSLVLPGNEDTTFVQHYATSLVSTETTRALRSATVVIDVTRTDGLPLNAVASYAAMVAFAEVRAGTNPPGSVLGLFAGGEPLRAPSAWDIAFLRALYRLPLDRTALRQRGILVGELVAATK